MFDQTNNHWYSWNVLARLEKAQSRRSILPINWNEKMPDFEEFEDDFEPLAPGGMVVESGMSDKQIEKVFETGRLRVVQEKNDIFLSHVLSFIKVDGDNVWGNLRPEYQRRLRWDNKKKSKLIESFIMNVPVPPVFLYEKELGRFEVMDGQQRLNAIAEFFSGKFPLEGLDIWKALNGKNYSTLPPLVRRGLDRAKISAITLTADNSTTATDSLDLRAQVFERLNTGGERLNPQELRNSLYSGSFNKLLIDLSKWDVFTMAWEIPDRESNTLADGTLSAELIQNTLFKRMADVEIILRFFAFRESDKLSGSVRSMLDGVMKRYRNADSETISKFDMEFRNAFNLCGIVFEDDIFRLPATNSQRGSRLSRPLYDAEIVALYHLRDFSSQIREKKVEIKKAVLSLAKHNAPTYDLMVGRGNTAATIKDRIVLVEKTIEGIINA